MRVARRALFDFIAAREDELGFARGDVVMVEAAQSENGDEWCEGSINGRSGLVPASYLEQETGGTAMELPDHLETSTEDVSDAYEGTVLVCLYTYDAAASDELSFREDDQLILLQKSEPDWWMMEHSITKNRGIVPVNYLGHVRHTLEPDHQAHAHKEAGPLPEGGAHADCAARPAAE